MSFMAECPFCHTKVQGVPDHYVGGSTDCPRCKNLFTLAPMLNPPKKRRKRVKKEDADSASSIALAVAPVPIAQKPSETIADVIAAASPPAEEPAVEEAQPVRRKPVNLFGLAAFHFGSVAFLAAAVPGLGLLTAP